MAMTLKKFTKVLGKENGSYFYIAAIFRGEATPSPKYAQDIASAMSKELHEDVPWWTFVSGSKDERQSLWRRYRLAYKKRKIAEEFRKIKEEERQS